MPTAAHTHASQATGVVEQVLQHGNILETMSQHQTQQGIMLHDILQMLRGEICTPTHGQSLPPGRHHHSSTTAQPPQEPLRVQVPTEDIPTLVELGRRTMYGPPGSSDDAFPHILALQFLCGVRCPLALEYDGVSRPRVSSKHWSGTMPSGDAARKRMSRLRSLWRRVFMVHTAATMPERAPGSCKDLELRRTLVEAHAQGDMLSWWKCACACDRSFQRAATTDVEKFDGTDTAAIAHMACTDDLGMAPAPC